VTRRGWRQVPRQRRATTAHAEPRVLADGATAQERWWPHSREVWQRRQRGGRRWTGSTCLARRPTRPCVTTTHLGSRWELGVTRTVTAHTSLSLVRTRPGESGWRRRGHFLGRRVTWRIIVGSTALQSLGPVAHSMCCWRGAGGGRQSHRQRSGPSAHGHREGMALMAATSPALNHLATHQRTVQYAGVPHLPALNLVHMPAAWI
jgi:hypothetical protein